MKGRARRLVPRLALGLGLACVLACASTRESRPAAGGPPDLEASGSVQLLLRGSLTNPQGTSRFRLALRRQTESFELAATDPFGRSAWMLSVGPGAALWVDHREKTACSLPRAGGLAPLGLAAVPLDSVARILLGQAPVPALDREVEFAAGFLRWRCVRDARGGLRSWTLEERGVATARWIAIEKGWVLSAPQSETRIEARVVAREPLRPGFTPRLTPPAGYSRQGCESAALP